MKPIIGIVGHPYINIDENLIFQATKSIVKKVSEHGGIPIIICPTQIDDYLNKKNKDINKLSFKEKNDLNEILEMCDGIIKPGGTRIYEYERYIYNYIYNKDKPYLGICAGMQIMSEQPNIKNNSIINHCSNEKYVHKIKIMHDTLLYRILNQEEIIVNSLHNYHIAHPGIHRVNAYSRDGVIEGIENPNKTFCIGVQWHPEGLDDINSRLLFDYFMKTTEKCKRKVKK